MGTGVQRECGQGRMVAGGGWPRRLRTQVESEAGEKGEAWGGERGQGGGGVPGGRDGAGTGTGQTAVVSHTRTTVCWGLSSGLS